MFSKLPFRPLSKDGWEGADLPETPKVAACLGEGVGDRDEVGMRRESFEGHSKGVKQEALTGSRQVPHSQSSLAFLTQVFKIFSYEIHTILCGNLLIFTF
jgi:hypothetical protein